MQGIWDAHVEAINEYGKCTSFLPSQQVKQPYRRPQQQQLNNDRSEWCSTIAVDLPHCGGGSNYHQHYTLPLVAGRAAQQGRGISSIGNAPSLVMMMVAAAAVVHNGLSLFPPWDGCNHRGGGNSTLARSAATGSRLPARI